MRALLDMRRVHKQFGALKAVNNISLDVAPGAVTSLVGPNGAGKTTLFNCISGVLGADSGDIRLHRGENDVPEQIRQRSVEQICRLGIARTFQHVRLFDSLSAVDNVVLGGLLHADLNWGAALLDRLTGRRRHKQLREEAMKYLARVGLEGQASRLAGELDHGNRRRLEIARALAAKPMLLLLDEPAAGMNRVETNELQRLLGTLCSTGMGVLLIEHDMKLVMQVSQHVYVMDHGEMLAEGKPADVVANPKVIEAYLGTTGQRYAAS